VGVGAVFRPGAAQSASEDPDGRASGAISGVLGGYLLLFPRARVLLGLPLGFLIVQIGRFPAIWGAGGLVFGIATRHGGLAARASDRRIQGGIAFGATTSADSSRGSCLVAFSKRRNVFRLGRRY